MANKEDVYQHIILVKSIIYYVILTAIWRNLKGHNKGCTGLRLLYRLVTTTCVAVATSATLAFVTSR